MKKRCWGFKADFFAAIADAVATEGVYLDLAAHDWTDVIESWIELVDMMLSAVRDGFYEQIRQVRRELYCKKSDSIAYRRDAKTIAINEPTVDTTVDATFINMTDDDRQIEQSSLASSKPDSVGQYCICSSLIYSRNSISQCWDIFADKKRWCKSSTSSTTIWWANKWNCCKLFVYLRTKTRWQICFKEKWIDTASRISAYDDATIDELSNDDDDEYMRSCSSIISVYLIRKKLSN